MWGLTNELKGKYKEAYREALWRRLDIETKMKEHWQDKKNFTELLHNVAQDTQLLERSKALFTDNHIQQSMQENI